METAAIQNLILRVMAFLLLLISLIVMVTSKTTSVIIDLTSGDITSSDNRFQDFKPFRFVVAANAIGCAYSFIRIIQGFIGLSGGFGFYLSFIFDQAMACIVLSSASAGIACTMLVKEVYQGAGYYDAAAKKFFRYASASVSIELLGFVMISACAAMSTYSLSCYLYLSTINSVPGQGIPAPNIATKQQGDVA